MNAKLDVERAVSERYSRAAQAREETLCCPVSYDPRYLTVMPEEIRERDYGCGDPSAFVGEGDVVLDFGSGTGKICYIAAQVVGPTGRVIGVDANEEMLALAEKHRETIGDRIGYHNVEFRKGRIQDLRLDLALVDTYLAENPISSASDLARFEAYCAHIKLDRPLIADESIDITRLRRCQYNVHRFADHST